MVAGSKAQDENYHVALNAGVPTMPLARNIASGHSRLVGV